MHWATTITMEHQMLPPIREWPLDQEVKLTQKETTSQPQDADARR